MAGIQLKVTPEVLKAKAQEITTQINKVQSDWNKVSTLVENSKSYWEGEASEVHRRLKKELDDDVERIIKRLKEHPQDLLKMADIYLDADRQVTLAISSLPDDVII